MTVNIDAEVPVNLPFDYKKIAEAVINQALNNEGFPYEAEVSVLLTNNEGIHEINLEQRKIDRPTDVLSFPMIDYYEPGVFDVLDEEQDCFNPESGEVILGDIVISLDKVKEQAKEYGHSQKREFAFLIAHSMFHLLGYDHVNSQEEAAVMEAKQRKVLENLKIGREEEMEKCRNFSSKDRVVIKIGEFCLTYPDTGKLNYVKMETLVRELCNLKNSGKQIILVSSGAIALGRELLQLEEPMTLSEKQACAAAGQTQLTVLYQKLFSEYGQKCSQLLITQKNVLDETERFYVKNVINELLSVGAIPLVNENSTVAVQELSNLEEGEDNDKLSAIAAYLSDADLLIRFTEKKAGKEEKNVLDAAADQMILQYLGNGSNLLNRKKSGAKAAEQIASAAGIDSVVLNGEEITALHCVMEGEEKGEFLVGEVTEEEDVLSLIAE